MGSLKRKRNVASKDTLNEQKKQDGLARLIKQKYEELGPYT
jgi:hypothetical protein